MKELKMGCWLQLAILFMAIALAAFLVGRFTEAISLGGFFSPVLATDAEVSQHIESTGITLPKGASKLAYLHVGFEEHCVWVAMELSSPERTALAAEWLARAKVKPEPISAHRIVDFDPSRYQGIKGDLSRFGITMWKNIRAVSARDPHNLFEYAVFEDLDSDRLVLYSWRE